MCGVIVVAREPGVLQRAIDLLDGDVGVRERIVDVEHLEVADVAGALAMASSVLTSGPYASVA